MRHSKCIRGFVMQLLLIFSFNAVLVPAVQAGMLQAEDFVQQELRVQQIDKVQAFLARGEIQAQLQQWGVDPQHASARVALLSDAELQQAAELAEAPAGAGVVGAIVLIFLVLLITDILGLTDVFSFVKKH